MFRFIASFCLLAALVAAPSCGQKEKPASQKAPEPQPAQSSPNVSTNQTSYPVKGVVKEIKADGKTAKIKHEEIPGYMAAMTMDFEAKNTNELRGLKTGDVISFKLVVTDNDAWLEDVRKLSATSPVELPSRQTVRVARDVEPLQPGDTVPEYHFTNQLGQPVSLRQFKGNAVAVTFIFTTCPLPTFCPRMSKNFSEAQQKLKDMPNAPTNWHLLTVSFDPEKDTPEVLKTYAELRDYDPAHWSFLTGDLTEITAFCEQFGQMFWREGGTINHNLRTAVIDTEGKVQRIIPANEWKSDELVEELLKAAKKP
jgi:protein SCO1